MLCVDWRRHDRRTWITGARLRVMQEYAACRGEVEWKKKGIAMVMSGVPREKKQRFRRGANLKKKMKSMKFIF